MEPFPTPGRGPPQSLATEEDATPRRKLTPQGMAEGGLGLCKGDREDGAGLSKEGK